jgi:hypothetical protein
MDAFTYYQGKGLYHDFENERCVYSLKTDLRPCLGSLTKLMEL